MPEPAARLKNLPAYVFAEISERVRELQLSGVDVVRLDIGSPDLPPPDNIIAELYASAKKQGNHGYSGYRGIASFREAVARYYKRRFNVNIDPEREVLPLIGSKEGIINLTLAYIDKGDIALVPDIGYPAYAMGTQLAGGTVEWIPTDSSFMLDFEKIPVAIAEKAKLLWVSYPNNPTGAIVDTSFYTKLVDYCRKHDILIASDNPYVDIIYGDYVAPSILEVDSAKDISVEFMSLSKTYNMAGWRIGAAVGNREALKQLLNVKSNIDSGHFKPIYDASTLALDTISQEWIQERNLIYQERRDAIMTVLPALGLSAQMPKASLYVWAKIPAEFGQDDVSYVNKVLQETSVSIAPGSAYGPGGDGYVRLSLTIPKERIQVALERLEKWSSKIGVK